MPPDYRPPIEVPLETALGSFRLTPVRARSIHVATGSGRWSTVDRTALAVNAQLHRGEDGRWRLAALFAEPRDHHGPPEPAQAGAERHARIREALVPAVQAWADANPHVLWYVEWLFARDRQLRRLRQLREQFATVEDLVHAVVTARQEIAVTEAALARHVDPPPVLPPAAIPQE